MVMSASYWFYYVSSGNLRQFLLGGSGVQDAHPVKISDSLVSVVMFLPSLGKTVTERIVLSFFDVNSAVLFIFPAI